MFHLPGKAIRRSTNHGGIKNQRALNGSNAMIGNDSKKCVLVIVSLDLVFLYINYRLCLMFNNSLCIFSSLQSLFIGFQRGRYLCFQTKMFPYMSVSGHCHVLRFSLMLCNP